MPEHIFHHLPVSSGWELLHSNMRVKRHKSLTLTAHVRAHEACSCYSQSLLPAHTLSQTHTHTITRSHIFSLGGEGGLEVRLEGKRQWDAKGSPQRWWIKEAAVVSIYVSHNIHIPTVPTCKITTIKYLYSPSLQSGCGMYTYSIWNCTSGKGWSLNIVHTLPLWVIWLCKEVATSFNSPGQGCLQWEL